MFSGVCTVVTDINAEQSKYTTLFSERDAVVTLGILDPQDNRWVELYAKDVIAAILSNRNRQKVLIENAKHCFPSNGASRVLAEISVLCLK